MFLNSEKAFSSKETYWHHYHEMCCSLLVPLLHRALCVCLLVSLWRGDAVGQVECLAVSCLYWVSVDAGTMGKGGAVAIMLLLSTAACHSKGESQVHSVTTDKSWILCSPLNRADNIQIFFRLHFKTEFVYRCVKFSNENRIFLLLGYCIFGQFDTWRWDQ